MRLIIVRHAKAERDSVSGRDADRALTSRGLRQARWLASALAALPEPERPALVLASPFCRARQTAEPIASALRAELRFEAALEVGRRVEGVLALIEHAARGASPGAAALPIALVGHNPQLEILLGVLVRGLNEAGALMRTGEARILDVPDPARPSGRATLLGSLRLDDNDS